MVQPVILCGGSGTRLWPLSREHHPKPLHAVNGERTLLQQTALRCAGDPLVVCNESHRFLAAVTARQFERLIDDDLRRRLRFRQHLVDAEPEDETVDDCHALDALVLRVCAEHRIDLFAP